MSKQKLRYKYRTVEVGFELEKVLCPVCGNPINWIKPIDDYSLFSHKVTLLAECWEGSASQRDMPRHLFLIRIPSLPIVEITKLYDIKANQKERI